jgi:secondary thiamine-phosphate synthase enzyme
MPLESIAGFEPAPRTELRLRHDRVALATRKRVQFIDITELVRERVRRSGVDVGLVNVQTKHTTAAIVVNENEHRLLRDFEERLEAWAPREAAYSHNDLDARRFSLLAPDEKPNGDAHARALLLGTSQTLHISDGGLELGRWQKMFLVELDGPRERNLSILILGQAPSWNQPEPL